jgi:hypothetical protein
MMVRLRNSFAELIKAVDHQHQAQRSPSVSDAAQLPMVGLQISLTQICEQLRTLGPRLVYLDMA